MKIDLPIIITTKFDKAKALLRRFKQSNDNEQLSDYIIIQKNYIKM